MDLLRSTVKCLLYDWPIEPVAEYVFNQGKDSRTIEDKSFLKRFTELMKWRETSFTVNEAEILCRILEDEWMADARWRDRDFYERIMVCASHCAESLLNIGGNIPDVKFRHLLRWRDLTLLTDEDILICSALARFDSENNLKRDNLLWTRPLGHDNNKLNAFLKEELSDTHAHLNASSEMFEVNWLAAMNHPKIFLGKQASFFLGELQEYDPVRCATGRNLTLAQWGVVAAELRMRIFRLTLMEPTYSNLSAWEVPVEDADDIREIADRVDSLIPEARKNAVRATGGYVLDYAFTKKDAADLSDREIMSPETLLYGERSLLYKSLRMMNDRDRKAMAMSSSLYLYVLIKNKIRREFVQTNRLRGFGNFSTYEHRKGAFLASPLNENTIDAYWDAAIRYSVQSSLCHSSNRHFEARVGAGQIRSLRSTDLARPIYPVYDDDMKPMVFGNISRRLSIVVHFFKTRDAIKKEGKQRWDYARKSLDTNFSMTLAEIRKNGDTGIPFVTGIDAAGTELNCPPEVFAPYFREARLEGIRNLTYHVGEDFYDLVHGTRMIDEAIRFLGLAEGSRLGHALAMGTDAERYYSERHHMVIIPKQILLDNVVWMKFKAMEWNVTLQPSTLFFIRQQFHTLIHDLKYPDCEPFDYWQSMSLRDKDLSGVEDAYSDDSRLKMAVAIYRTYTLDQDCHDRGWKTVSCSVPSNFDRDVDALQRKMRLNVTKKGITIEANPSSNLKIGAYRRYQDLPLFTFHTIAEEGDKMSVSVNTDDKGIFGTSLETEYSLLALAILKAKDTDGNLLWNRKLAEDYLRRLAHYGNITRFSDPFARENPGL